MEKIDTLILDPDLDRRMRLKQVTSTLVQFGKVTLASSFADALQKINKLDQYIILFVSSSYLNSETSKQELFRFIQDAKNSKQGQDSAYILVLGAEHQKNTTIANSALNGVDSFLNEPFSVDSLLETTTLAHSLYKQRKRMREEKLIEFLVADLLRNLDGIVSNVRGGAAPGEAMRGFKEVAKTIAALEPGLHSVYYNALITLSGQARGRTAEVKTEQSEKALERLRKRFQEQGMDFDKSDSSPKSTGSSGPRIIVRR